MEMGTRDPGLEVRYSVSPREHDAGTLAGPPLQHIAHGRGNHGDSKGASIPHFSAFAEVEPLLTAHFKTDLERAAQGNHAVGAGENGAGSREPGKTA